MGKSSQFFRANAGIALVNAKRQVLAFERIDIPGAWQLPQGGFRQDEEPIDAAMRELQEETGLTPARVKLIDEMPDWITYELPASMRSEKTGRGQAQKWFVFEFLGEDSEIDLNRKDSEFTAYKWTGFDELINLVPDFWGSV